MSDIIELVWLKSSSSTAAIHHALPSIQSPPEASSAMAALRRSSRTRSPVWSDSAPHAYGANTRVNDCTDASRLITTMGSPRSFSHSGRYGLKNPMCAK